MEKTIGRAFSRFRRENKSFTEAYQSDKELQLFRPAPSSSTVIFNEIGSMPFELWQCIFIALYRSVPIAHRPHVLRTLTGVCQDWKAVALASPELWTAIPAINIFEGMDTKVEVNLTRRFLAQTKRYLDLSGVLPVDLTIHLHRNARPPVNPMAPELIEFLVRHSKRWRSVDAEVPHEMVYHLAGAEGRIPYLERLRLSTFEKVFGDRELSTKPKKFLIDCFSVAPRLHTVEIGIDVAFNETTNFPKVKILLPFHQLQSFTILTTYRTTFYEDMCASPTNLRTLIIHAHYTASNLSHTAFPTATLPRLERLVYQIHSAPVLLESLTLPSLTDLSIPVAPITVQSISNLIVRSRCSLQRLVLGAFVRAQSDAWRELLSRLDTVTHLDLLDPRVKHLKLLVMAPSICNLPNLQYLTFRNVERGYSDWDSDRTLRTFAGVFNSRSVKASEESGLFQPLRQVAFKWAKEDKMLKSMWRLESFLYSPNPTDELEMDRDSGELLNELASKAAKVLRGAKRLYALERRSNHARSRVGWNELPGEEPPMSKEDVELDLVLQKMESIDPTDVRLTWFLRYGVHWHLERIATVKRCAKGNPFPDPYQFRPRCRAILARWKPFIRHHHTAPSSSHRFFYLSQGLMAARLVELETPDNDEAEIWTVLDWRKELTVVDRPYIPEEAP